MDRKLLQAIKSPVTLTLYISLIIDYILYRKNLQFLANIIAILHQNTMNS